MKIIDLLENHMDGNSPKALAHEIVNLTLSIEWPKRNDLGSATKAFIDMLARLVPQEILEQMRDALDSEYVAEEEHIDSIRDRQ